MLFLPLFRHCSDIVHHVAHVLYCTVLYIYMYIMYIYNTILYYTKLYYIKLNYTVLYFNVHTVLYYQYYTALCTVLCCTPRTRKLRYTLYVKPKHVCRGLAAK
jgi:hypothetical protein